MSATSFNRSFLTMPVLGMLALGHCLAFVDRNLPAVAAPLLKADLGLSDTQIGLLDGPAFALLYVAGILASWPLARSRQRFRLLAACIATWGLGMVLFAVGPSFLSLVVGRALVGLGQAAYVPLALGLIVERAALSWRARWMAVFTAGAVIGRSLSFLLGGVALALLARWLPHAGLAHWRLLFLAMAVPNLVLIVALWCQAEPFDTMASPPRHVFTPLLLAFRKTPASLGAYLCGAAASVLVVHTVGAWAPSVLHREQGLTPAMAASVFGSLLLAASPLGHLIAGALVDKRNRNVPPAMIMAYGLLFVIPVLYLIPRAGSAEMACVLLALASLAGGIAGVAALAGLPSMLHPTLHDAGLRIFLAFITVTGVALGPFMTGVVSDGLGLGRHGLSLALSHVCVGAAVVGMVTALLAGTGGSRQASERVG